MYNNHILKIMFVMLFFSQNLFAGELLNVGLRVNMKYETFGEACHLRALFRHYNLSLEIKDQQVSRAQLTKLNVFGPENSYPLNEQDAASFDVRTQENLVWIKSFSASPILIKQLLKTAEGLGRGDSCQPPHDLVFDDLEHTYIDFGVERIDHLLPHLIESEPIILRGYLSNAEPFRIELTLTQDRT